MVTSSFVWLGPDKRDSNTHPPFCRGLRMPIGSHEWSAFKGGSDVAARRIYPRSYSARIRGCAQLIILLIFAMAGKHACNVCGASHSQLLTERAQASDASPVKPFSAPLFPFPATSFPPSFFQSTLFHPRMLRALS